MCARSEGSGSMGELPTKPDQTQAWLYIPSRSELGLETDPQAGETEAPTAHPKSEALWR